MDFTLQTLLLQANLAQAGALSGTAASAPVPQHVADSFAQMMETSVMAPPAPKGSKTGAMMSEIVRGQDQAFQTVANDALYMMDNCDLMNVNELTAAAVQVQLESASLQVDMQTKMGVVTSTKDAIETLMKNQ